MEPSLQIPWPSSVGYGGNPMHFFLMLLICYGSISHWFFSSSFVHSTADTTSVWSFLSFPWMLPPCRALPSQSAVSPLTSTVSPLLPSSYSLWLFLLATRKPRSMVLLITTAAFKPLKALALNDTHSWFLHLTFPAPASKSTASFFQDHVLRSHSHGSWLLEKWT